MCYPFWKLATAAATATERTGRAAKAFENPKCHRLRSSWSLLGGINTFGKKSGSVNDAATGAAIIFFLFLLVKKRLTTSTGDFPRVSNRKHGPPSESKRHNN